MPLEVQSGRLPGFRDLVPPQVPQDLGQHNDSAESKMPSLHNNSKKMMYYDSLSKRYNFEISPAAGIFLIVSI